MLNGRLSQDARTGNPEIKQYIVGLDFYNRTRGTDAIAPRVGISELGPLPL
jgi:hypothetical protein